MGYDVFISYRRSDGAEAARLIALALQARGLTVFLDVTALGAGHFDDSLLRRIEEARCFVPILTKQSFDRPDTGDWFYREIRHALAGGQMVVPIMMPGFSFPPPSVLPEGLHTLPRHQSISYSHEFFEAALGKLTQYIRAAEDSATLRGSGYSAGVGDGINHPVEQLPGACTSATPPPPAGQEPLTETFGEPVTWASLRRIGEWRIDPTTGVVQGTGMYAYLLSKNQFGRRPFRITANLSFLGYSKHAAHTTDNANAGIIFGWSAATTGHRYHNLLLSGTLLVLEHIGFKSGDDYRDYRHADEGAPLRIQDGTSLRMAISIGEKKIDVFVDGIYLYSTRVPPDHTGLVGLRPWRSTLKCEHFEVTEA